MEKTLPLLGIAIIVATGMLFMLFSSHRSGVATVPFTTLAQGTDSTVASRTNYLITTQSQLAELWTFLKQPPPVPTVDFSSKVVAAIFAGELPTTGYSIAVAAVEDAGKRIVKVDIEKPDQSCVLAQSTTAPYQVVELPKTSLPFTHDDIWTTKVCQ